MTQNETQLREFFDEAFWMQRGQYYPERHQENLWELREKHEWPGAVIDSLYRVACHLDDVIAKIAKEIVNYEKSFMEGFREIHDPVFYDLSDQFKKLRLENELGNLDFHGDFEKLWHSCCIQTKQRNQSVPKA